MNRFGRNWSGLFRRLVFAREAREGLRLRGLKVGGKLRCEFSREKQGASREPPRKTCYNRRFPLAAHLCVAGLILRTETRAIP